jgi:hypothetical protein
MKEITKHCEIFRQITTNLLKSHQEINLLEICLKITTGNILSSTEKNIIYCLIAYGSFLSQDLILLEAPTVPKNLDPTVTLVLPSILEQKRLFRGKIGHIPIFFFRKKECALEMSTLFYKIASLRDMAAVAYYWIHKIFLEVSNAVRDSTK